MNNFRGWLHQLQQYWQQVQPDRDPSQPARQTQPARPDTPAPIALERSIPGLMRLGNPRTTQKLWRRTVIALCLTLGLWLPQFASVVQAQSASQLPRPSHTREFRGAWAATVVNIDWPSQPGLSVDQQKAELITMLDKMQALNLNALVLQVRPAGDAFYKSDLEPWSYWLTAQQGRAPSPFYDPLEFAIAEAHARGIELHAWFNPYRAKMSTNYALAANHMAKRFPQYAYTYGDLIWMDPGAADVQQLTYDVILDVVRRYDVDGIHFDDYFYPYPKPGIEFPDGDTYAAYRRSGGALSLADWRRDNVNKLVQRLHDGIKAEKPEVKFGISPFGIYRPGQPAGIVGMDQYNEIYADPKLWLDRGWVDYIAPQLYWRINQTEQSYPVLLNWWTANNPQNRHIYVGNYLSKIDSGAWSNTEFQNQVNLSRQAAARLSLGNIFFSVKVFLENRQNATNYFRQYIYPTPALVPPMSWLDNTPPAAVKTLTAGAGEVSWSVETTTEPLKGFTLYKQTGNTWTLQRILPPTATRAIVPLGTYAVCAVDRGANESAPIQVTVRSLRPTPRPTPRPTSPPTPR